MSLKIISNFKKKLSKYIIRYIFCNQKAAVRFINVTVNQNLKWMDLLNIRIIKRIYKFKLKTYYILQFIWNNLLLGKETFFFYTLRWVSFISHKTLKIIRLYLEFSMLFDFFL